VKRLHLLIAAVAAVAVLAGCEIERTAVPKTTPRIALHGILSATAPNQVVILERTRSGHVPGYALGDPLQTDVLAETSAVVELIAPSGRTFLAVEDYRNPDNRGSGRGIYRFAIPGDSLERSGVYELRARTFEGQELFAETSVPAGASAVAPRPVAFDRANDTLHLDWPASAGARSYLVRIESPHGPLAFFTDSTHVRLTGELRNLDVTSLPHVFLPGFPQAVTVSAVDSNFYDWYRTHNNRVSGVGVVNRVDGGIGVFGSVVRIRFDSLAVVTPQTQPEDGFYDFDGTPQERSVTPNLSITIYTESISARGDQPNAVSGRYMRRPYLGMTGCVECGMLGTASAGHVELAMLTDWVANDTADVFFGFVRDNVLEGVYQRSGFRARFVKRP
jgi:hypothetical protein